MDIYSDSFLELCICLNKNGVRYIMVGGFATNSMVTSASLKMWTSIWKTRLKIGKNYEPLSKTWGSATLNPLSGSSLFQAG